MDFANLAALAPGLQIYMTMLLSSQCDQGELFSTTPDCESLRPEPKMPIDSSSPSPLAGGMTSTWVGAGGQRLFTLARTLEMAWLAAAPTQTFTLHMEQRQVRRAPLPAGLETALDGGHEK